MKPRKPTQAELEDLKKYLIENGKIDAENADLVHQVPIAVFDNYTTDCPGYSGKVLVVVWAATPEAIESFIWDNETIAQAGKSEW